MFVICLKNKRVYGWSEFGRQRLFEALHKRREKVNVQEGLKKALILAII